MLEFILPSSDIISVISWSKSILVRSLAKSSYFLEEKLSKELGSPLSNNHAIIGLGSS
jgi:hypothetical protein